jgi:hypothetical protein
MADQNIWLFSSTALKTCNHTCFNAISRLPIWHCTAPGRDFFLSFLHFFVYVRSNPANIYILHRLNINVDIKYDCTVGGYYKLFHLNLTLAKRKNSQIIRHRTPEIVPQSQGSLFYASWYAMWIAANLNLFTLVCITSGYATSKGYFVLPWRNKTNQCNLLFFAWRGVSVTFIYKSVLDPVKEERFGN